MRLVVYPETGAVRVSVPSDIDDNRVHAFIVQHLPWIKKQQRRLRQTKKKKMFPDIKKASAIYLHGTMVHIEVNTGASKGTSRRTRDGVVFSLPSRSTIEQREKVLERFYKKELKTYIESVVPIWERRMGEHITRISYRSMKTRWGSCTPKTGHVSLNIRLAALPHEYQIHVLVHELVHFKELGHGTRFKALMSQYLPDWKQQSERLKQYAQNIDEYNGQF